ncbi:DUF6702 family protein [Aquimarina gracilis]|uniref:DUF6702 family protein n=1 Tax=Aquimarina gracilis TaxID=874422 RepID=A0ABU5ZY13_9FLAO|nr:DUF6702 family protein [Aquimarina gracilis]MEB3346753.1 DUF6702 family protein [Aquimarina gracilis]
MKKIKLMFLFVLSITLCSFITHKFYVSVTQIEYNKERQSLQIISRVFIDDIEDLLQERYDQSIVLNVKEETSITEKYLEKYFDQKLKIKVNDKEVSFTFLGKEYEDDLMICYLEILEIDSLSSIEVSNDILMDYFEEQQNIVHVKKDNQRKSLILEKGKSNGLLNFSE